jgi:hypothetical protein
MVMPGHRDWWFVDGPSRQTCWQIGFWRNLGLLRPAMRDEKTGKNDDGRSDHHIAAGHIVKENDAEHMPQISSVY